MESINAYIPLDRRVALAQNQELPLRSSGTVLFADISGFTPLTAVLSQELGTRRGAEELTNLLNQVYGDLIGQVHQYRGSVISFSGDAITCWFEADKGKQAVSCAIAMQTMIQNFATVSVSDHINITFGLKIAITTGEATRFLVGNPDIQMTEVLTGNVVDRAGSAEQLLAKGEVIVDEKIATHLASALTITEWREDSETTARLALITALTPVAPIQPWPDLPDTDDKVAGNWLPTPVFQRLQSGEQGFLAELRSVIAMFIRFTGIDYDQPDAVAKLDGYIRWIQSILELYGGHLLQITIGDKGSYCYVVFGALVSYEDDAARAAAAALALQDLPSDFSYIETTQIGINMGRAHVGAYGSVVRRTYGVLGNVVNIAARLMSLAEPSQVVVTPRIRRIVIGQYKFADLGTVQLKGLPEPMPVFSLHGQKRSSSINDLMGERLNTPLVGREPELAILDNYRGALLNGRSQLVLMTGEAGIGKSHLIANVAAEAMKQQVDVLLGVGNAIETSAPYHVWRPILQQIFQLDTDASLSESARLSAWRHAVLSRLEALNSDLLSLAPLLNVILPLNIPENERTKQVVGENRAQNLQVLIADILQNMTKTRPILLLLEDMHWADSTSWALAQYVYQQVRPLFIIMTTRPQPEPLPNVLTILKNSPEIYEFDLITLPIGAVQQLIEQTLKVHEVPSPIIKLIYEKAEGHPFFSQELAFALRDTGLIEIVDGICRTTVAAGDLHKWDFPDTIQGVITSRIDQLPANLQLMLKVASAIGRIFSFRLLHDIHPVAMSENRMQDYLDDLSIMEITQLDLPAPNLEYIFKHMLTQEVTYSLLLFAQRRELHRNIAEWYEQNYTHNLSHYAPLLAHHWQQAEVFDKAIDYLEMAGEAALQNFANEEAVNFFSQALSIDAKEGNISSRERCIHWHLQLGKAYILWTSYVKGREHIETGLALLGESLPKSTWRQTVGLIAQILRQSQMRLLPSNTKHVPETEIMLLRGMADTDHSLVEVYFYGNELILSPYVAFLELNSAEQMQRPSRELAQASATIGSFWGFLGRHKWAKSYYKRGRETAVSIDNLAAEAYVSLAAGYYYMGNANWTEAESTLQHMINATRQLGDWRRWEDGVSNLMRAAIFQGDFVSSIQWADELYESSEKRHDPSYQIASIQNLAYNYFHLGQLDKAFSYIKSAKTMLEAHPDLAYQTVQLRLHGLQAMACLHQADFKQALVHVTAGVEILNNISWSNNLTTYQGMVLTVEGGLRLWEQGYSATELPAQIQIGCNALQAFARTFAVGHPRALLYQGWQAHLMGKQNKAMRLWQKCLTVSERLQMPYDLARAQFELGRHLPIGDKQRTHYLQMALRGFEKMETAVDSARVKAEMEKSA